MGLFNDIKQGQKMFGEDVSSVINFILLSGIYLVSIGLTSIFAKISGKHFLELDINKNRESYWSDLNLVKKPIKEYYRQF